MKFTRACLLLLVALSAVANCAAQVTSPTNVRTAAPTTPVATPTPPPESGSSGNTTTWIAVGVCVGVVALIAGLIFSRRNTKKQQEKNLGIPAEGAGPTAVSEISIAVAAVNTAGMQAAPGMRTLPAQQMLETA